MNAKALQAEILDSLLRSARMAFDRLNRGMLMRHEVEAVMEHCAANLAAMYASRLKPEPKE